MTVRMVCTVGCSSWVRSLCLVFFVRKNLKIPIKTYKFPKNYAFSSPGSYIAVVFIQTYIFSIFSSVDHRHWETCETESELCMFFIVAVTFCVLFMDYIRVMLFFIYLFFLIYCSAASRSPLVFAWLFVVIPRLSLIFLEIYFWYLISEALTHFKHWGSFPCPSSLFLPPSTSHFSILSPLMQLGGLGERCKLPIGPDGAQPPNTFWCILR